MANQHMVTGFQCETYILPKAFVGVSVDAYIRVMATCTVKCRQRLRDKAPLYCNEPAILSFKNSLICLIKSGHFTQASRICDILLYRCERDEAISSPFAITTRIYLTICLYLTGQARLAEAHYRSILSRPAYRTLSQPAGDFAILELIRRNPSKEQLVLWESGDGIDHFLQSLDQYTDAPASKASCTVDEWESGTVERILNARLRKSCDMIVRVKSDSDQGAVLCSDEAISFLNRLAEAHPSLGLELFHHFRRALRYQDEGDKRRVDYVSCMLELLAKGPSTPSIHLHPCVGRDEDGERLVFEAISKVHDSQQVTSQQWQRINVFLRSGGFSVPPRLLCLRSRCLEHERSPISVYLEWKQASLDDTIEMYTLGNGVTDQAVETLRGLWLFLYRYGFADLGLPDQSGVIFKFKLQPPHKEGVKIYLPVDMKRTSQAEIDEALKLFRGQKKETDGLKKLFRPATRLIASSYVGYMYDSMGVQLTFYSTQVVKESSYEEDIGVERPRRWL